MSKNKKTSHPKASPLSHRLLKGLSEAESLRTQGQFPRALKILEELDSQHPNQFEVLALLVEVSYQMQAYVTYEWAVYRVWRLKPGSLEVTTNLAGAYMLADRAGLALRTFNAVLKRWPNHAQAAEISQVIEELRANILSDIQYPGLDESGLLELSAEQDEVRFLMLHNQLYQSKKLAEKLLKAYPGLVSLMNNMVQIQLIEGNQSEARRISSAVLEIDFENIHALAQSARILFLSGDIAGVSAMAQRLENNPSQALERWIRLAEIYSFLDDQQQLLDLYERAEQAGALDASSESALLLHLAAVAVVRLGDEPRARKLWKKALQILPTYDLPRQNLADLDLPAGQRNGPWAYNLSFWVPLVVIQEMSRSLAAPGKSKNRAVIASAVGKFTQLHPELMALLPDMLARGDANTRQFAIHFIRIAETPDLLALLKDFALSDRGTDEIRLDAVQALAQKGHLHGSLRLWIKGEWKETVQMMVEISREPTHGFKSPATEKLASHAVEALRAENGVHAQELLEEALKSEETPDLLNNLAMALEMQGQTERANEIIDSIHVQFPDYFFGIIAAANKAIVHDDLDEAKKMLDDLSERKRMHITEYTALCEAQIHLAHARENIEMARSWLGLWEKVYPDDPRLVGYKVLLSGFKLLDLMRTSLKKP